MRPSGPRNASTCTSNKGPFSKKAHVACFVLRWIHGAAASPIRRRIREYAYYCSQSSMPATQSASVAAAKRYGACTQRRWSR
eukprot:3984810-Pyramimonas_sp.AAC.1